MTSKKATPIAYVETKEQKRLNDAREKQYSLEEMGTLSQRTAMGNGPRGLQRRR